MEVYFLFREGEYLLMILCVVCRLRVIQTTIKTGGGNVWNCELCQKSEERCILQCSLSFFLISETLSHKQKIEQLRVGAEISFNHANSLLNVLEGDDCTLKALTARAECLVNCRDDRVREHAKKALSDLTNLAVMLECFVG